MKIILLLLALSLCFHHCNEDMSDYLWGKRHLFCSSFWTSKSRKHGTGFASQDKGAIQRVDGKAKQKANHMPTEKVETVGYPNRYHQQAPWQNITRKSQNNHEQGFMSSEPRSCLNIPSSPHYRNKDKEDACMTPKLYPSYSKRDASVSTTALALITLTMK